MLAAFPAPVTIHVEHSRIGLDPGVTTGRSSAQRQWVVHRRRAGAASGFGSAPDATPHAPSSWPREADQGSNL